MLLLLTSKTRIGISKNLRYNNGILNTLAKNIFIRLKALALLSLIHFILLFNHSHAGAVIYEGREYGPEYFFAIEGEVYGQAAPGVQAVYVNDRPVKIDKNLNFSTKVSLKEGEEYLSIVTLYKGLRFTKKYLVIRHPKAPKTFKIHVPEQEFQQIIRGARKVVKPPPPKPKPKPKASFGFKEREFTGPYTIKTLVQAIEADDYGIETKSPKGSLGWINEILRAPNFYDLWLAKNKNVILTAEMKRLIRETNGYRDKPFSQLTREQQLKIIRLNRLLIEATYPLFAPKSIPEGMLAEEDEKWLGFEFAAELEAGKIFVVRRINGKFFGTVLDTKTHIWFPLQEITYQEFRDLLEKGIIPSSFTS